MQVIAASGRTPWSSERAGSSRARSVGRDASWVSLWRMLNVDIIPGRANRLSARWADEIFVQFEESKSHLPSHAGRSMHTVGCPLRSRFLHPGREEGDRGSGLGREQARPADHRGIERFGADQRGDLPVAAETGSVCGSLADRSPDGPGQLQDRPERLSTGLASATKCSTITTAWRTSSRRPIWSSVEAGRSAWPSTPSRASRASACPIRSTRTSTSTSTPASWPRSAPRVIVDDVADPDDRVARLWKELEPLMADGERRRKMSEACKQVARPNAAAEIASRLIEMAQKQPSRQFVGCVPRTISDS